MEASLSALERLKIQLTCPICRDIFTNPRILPCQHSFCQHCLETLPIDEEEDKNTFIYCLTCHTAAELPNPDGLGGSVFPPDITNNNLKDIYNRLKKEMKQAEPQKRLCNACSKSDTTGICKECHVFLCKDCIQSHDTHEIMYFYMITASQVLPNHQDTTMKCSSHKKPLEIFCERCEELICQNCILSDHRDHDINLIAQSYPKHRSEVENKLKTIGELVASVSSSLAKLTDRESKVKEQGKTTKDEIHMMAEKFIRVIRDSEKELTRQVDVITEKKVNVLVSQKIGATRRLDQLNDTKQFVDSTLNVHDCEQGYQQVLKHKKHLMTRMNHLIEQINIDDFIPEEKTNVKFHENLEVSTTLHNLGSITFFSPAIEYKFKISEVQPHDVSIDQTVVSFPLSIKSSSFPGSFLEVPLKSLSCNIVSDTIPGPITTKVKTTTQPGIYTIDCSPTSHGPHQLRVQIDNIDFSSIPIVLPFNPYLDNISPVRIIPKVYRPWGIAVTKDKWIIITDNYYNCLTILDKDGRKIYSFDQKGENDKVKITYPRGVAVTSDNHLLVTDDHKIQKITIDGMLVKSVGVKGTGECEFNQPLGITISPLTQQIYIADLYNYRIQVLNSDLTFSHMFGTYGSGKGQFYEPNHIAIDSEGLVYVTDTKNHRIQKFTPNGQFLSQISTYGWSPGQLYLPESIIINGNFMYITEHKNHRISVFTTSGEFVQCFGNSGKDKLNWPRGIAADQDGFLYVCDHMNYRIVVY